MTGGRARPRGGRACSTAMPHILGQEQFTGVNDARISGADETVASRSGASAPQRRSDGSARPVHRESQERQPGRVEWDRSPAAATATGMDQPTGLSTGSRRHPISGILTRQSAPLAAPGVSTDSARGPETTGNNRHQPDNQGKRTGRQTRGSGGPLHAR